MREATRFLRSTIVLEFIGDETGDASKAIGDGGESIFLPLFKPEPDTEERKGRGSMEGRFLSHFWKRGKEQRRDERVLEDRGPTSKEKRKRERKRGGNYW